MPGPEGPPADIEPLEEQVKTLEKTVTNLQNVTNEITKHQNHFVVRINTETERVHKKHDEVLKTLTTRKHEIIKESTTITNRTCTECTAKLREKAKDTGVCCEDCNLAKFKVPTAEECAEAGCADADGACAYASATCDAKGNILPSCKFPFTYMGTEHNQCISHSPFGLTKRSWCFVEDPCKSMVTELFRHTLCREPGDDFEAMMKICRDGASKLSIMDELKNTPEYAERVANAAVCDTAFPTLEQDWGFCDCTQIVCRDISGPAAIA